MMLNIIGNMMHIHGICSYETLAPRANPIRVPIFLKNGEMAESCPRILKSIDKFLIDCI